MQKEPALHGASSPTVQYVQEIEKSKHPLPFPFTWDSRMNALLNFLEMESRYRSIARSIKCNQDEGTSALPVEGTPGLLRVESGI